MVAWTLVVHIIGLVFWVGGLLVVTHTLAAHVDETSVDGRAALARLESKLLKGLVHPGAAIVVITGFILVAHNPVLLHQYWLHAKLLLVVILIALDLRVTFRAKGFQEGSVEMTRGECMGLHGAIALVFTIILILVLIRPGASSAPHSPLREVAGASELQKFPDVPVKIFPGCRPLLTKSASLQLN